MTRPRLLRALLMSLSLFLAAAVALDAHGRRARVEPGHDAIVVAGCRVLPDGRPSQALARRTRHAVALWQQGVAPVLVFTGGLGAAPIAESEAAAALARELGVPAQAIVTEGRSTSTEENARYAAAALRDAGLPHGRIVVVSDSYHVWRARRVFARHFDQVAGAGSTPEPAVRVRGSLREVLAVAGYAAAGRLSRGERGIYRG